jgi:MerR HTH family regulatory protein
MKSSATMTIGEVAGHFGLATDVLRHWETMGLLSLARATAVFVAAGPLCRPCRLVAAGRL